MPTIEKTIDVEVPVSTAYNQWTQFEEFPRFMEGVERVEQRDAEHLHWVADVAGQKKEWDATITEQTLPTLLNDLDDRGLLDTTLVVWMGEFGRTPKINTQNSRDHWPQCYTTLLAGGGVKRGFVHGASDKSGAYPAKDPVRPDDLAATSAAVCVSGAEGVAA